MLKPRMVLKTRSDWLLKLQIAFAIHLRATRAGLAPENIVIVAGINEIKSSFVLCYLSVLVYTYTTFHFSGSGWR